ncbi:ring-1,2-phenylacetyl-CoA epoxidase subunit PaaC [Burkholderiales bacterium]|nr:ring-1,2-phenylacetyl-CoA epoxidase subunit PaaC [Burkholderiales bacterium]
MKDTDRFEFLLRFGDSALVLAQRLSEWVGKGPIVEEDIALTNVGLDLVGQARMWLSCAGEVEGRGRDEDALAFRRDAHEFRNALLVEQPNGGYADTMARQFLFDHWHLLALKAMEGSRDERVAAIAAKSAKEVAYHVERSTDWVIRLGDGTDVSHERMQDAIDGLWMFAGELLLPDAVDDAAARAGIGPDLAALASPWREAVGAALAEATIAVPADDWAQRGGRQGRHTEHLGHLLAELQFLQRAYPGAQW